MHAAYVEEDEIPAYVDMTQQGLSGGIEGDLVLQVILLRLLVSLVSREL